MRRPNCSGGRSRSSSALSFLQVLDARGHAVERLAPEELDVGLGGRGPLGGLGGAAEVEQRVGASVAGDRLVLERRALGPVVLTVEGDVVLGPVAAYEPHELPGAGVAVRLVALVVAVLRLVVRAAHDVDLHPAAAQLVERGGRRGEVGRGPVARPDRDERVERRGGRGERRGQREGVRSLPPGADQRTTPAVVLHQPRHVGQPRQAVVPVDGRVRAVAGGDLVGDVPEELHAEPFKSLSSELLQ